MPPRCRCPHNVALKRPEEFKLIGTPAKRLDIAGKVNGTATSTASTRDRRA